MIPEPTETGPDRLDSWKAVAEYLGRDVATARRWEKTAGLPVHRVAGARGRSIFAYRSEVDSWLKQTPAKPSILETSKRQPIRHWIIAVAAIALAVLSVSWRVRTSHTNEVLRFETSADGIVARGSDGHERWRYAFPDTQQTELFNGDHAPPVMALTGAHPGVLVAVSQRFDRESKGILSGQLLWLSPGGAFQHAVSLDDRLRFGSGEYSPIWSMIDVRVDRTSGGQRIALAAHHYQWWPSLVTVLDERWARVGTFVNAGWMERVHWLSRDRLVVAGFSNARDGGMIALLDANAPSGQSPTADGSPFRCLSCESGGPLRYVVLPRSEVNRATISPFNRVTLEVTGDRLVARTIEVPSINGEGIDVLYEFSPGLDVIRASFSDRYWDKHRALEMEGKITHTRDQCPDRDGPRTAEVWEPGTGWTITKIRQ